MGGEGQVMGMNGVTDGPAASETTEVSVCVGGKTPQTRRELET